jgi:hypothetical protein
MDGYYTHNNAILFTIDSNRHLANSDVSITFDCLDFRSCIAENPLCLGFEDPSRPDIITNLREFHVKWAYFCLALSETRRVDKY